MAEVSALGASPAFLQASSNPINATEAKRMWFLLVVSGREILGEANVENLASHYLTRKRAAARGQARDTGANGEQSRGRTRRRDGKAATSVPPSEIIKDLGASDWREGTWCAA
jgi:hypothetical protein